MAERHLMLGRQLGQGSITIVTPREREIRPSALDTETNGHLFIEEAASGTIGLHPFAINYKLRDRPLTGVAENFLGGAGRGLDVDFFVREIVLCQEALGFAAVRTPRRRVNDQFH